MADPSSLSAPHEAVITHIDWNADVNFETKIISAKATYSVDVLSNKTRFVKFDTVHLLVKSCSLDDQPVGYSLSPVEEEKSHLGSCLTIELPIDESPSEDLDKRRVSIIIDYETTDKCTAAQWLPPSQTAGKVHPYLFTQCQAIHARSLIPCQDCPGVKFTYSARISTPVWATCVMSAISKSSSVDKNIKSYFFDQPVPISSYLLALAVGDLTSSEISPRCRVWTEPSLIEATAYEFGNTEEFLETAESLTGLAYPWGRYDILCLPPSFPYGGMENPCLTFVTPTLLAGDRSLVDVIAHEISHSWTGNLVTNATWDHFWLNEGWTTWLQRKIMSRMPQNEKHLPYKFIDFDALSGWADLQDSVDQFPLQYSRLIPGLGDADPDDAFSSVPYEKGFHLLYALERIVGEENFLIFFVAYLSQFKFLTVTSDQFRTFTMDYFHDHAQIASFDWDAWFNKPGMPPMPLFDRSLADEAEGLAHQWISFQDNRTSIPKVDVTNWSCDLLCCFLDTIISTGKPLNLETVLAMKETYNFGKTNNSEILHRFCEIALDAGDETILPVIVRFITTQGRMKFVRPLYKKLFQSKMGKDLAISTFILHKDFYHPIAAKMLANDLSVVDEEKKLKTTKCLLQSPFVLTGVALGAGLALLALLISRKKK